MRANKKMIPMTTNVGVFNLHLGLFKVAVVADAFVVARSMPKKKGAYVSGNSALPTETKSNDANPLDIGMSTGWRQRPSSSNQTGHAQGCRRGRTIEYSAMTALPQESQTHAMSLELCGSDADM